MKTNICPVCGKGSLKKEIIEERFTYKGQSMTIPNYIVYRCNLCGEAIVDKQTLKSSGKQLKNFKCKVDGLLTGDQIKDIRRRLGFTQEQMSELLGGGLKSFARYEAGKICQSKAMDNLLRILDKFPQVVQFIQGTSQQGSHGFRIIVQSLTECGKPRDFRDVENIMYSNVAYTTAYASSVSVKTDDATFIHVWDIFPGDITHSAYLSVKDSAENQTTLKREELLR